MKKASFFIYKYIRIEIDKKLVLKYCKKRKIMII